MYHTATLKSKKCNVDKEKVSDPNQNFWIDLLFAGEELNVDQALDRLKN